MKIVSKLYNYLLRFDIFYRHIGNYYENKNKKALPKHLMHINKAEIVTIKKTNPKNLKIKIGISKSGVISKNIKTDYTYKQARLLLNNNLNYSLINLHTSNWIEEAKKLDIIIWQTGSAPSPIYETRSKLYFLEEYLGKFCFPNYREIWSYEDKIRLNYILSQYSIPLVPTFISFDRAEAYDFVKNTKYPIVSKLTTCSGSRGVKLIKSKMAAKNLVNKVFSIGAKTPYNYLKQKDYVYFQDFIPEATYDLRIILVGDKIMGYYRMKPNNDFRASGAGNFFIDELPIDAVKTAIKVKKILKSRIIAVDFIDSKNGHLVIEASIFTGRKGNEMFTGYYTLNNDEQLVFHEGKYWLQELVLKEVVEEYINKQS